MKKWVIIAAFLFALSAHAQSITLNESSTYTAPRIGTNTCTTDYFSCFLEKNITPINPGFEGQETATLQQVTGSATTTSFTGNNTCDQVPPNYFAVGGTYYVAFSAGSGNTGHSGTISANTGPNNDDGQCNGAPVFTISATPSALQAGDIVFVYATGPMTSLDFADFGWGPGHTNGSGTAVIDTTSGDQFADGGKQNIKLSLTSASDTAGIETGYDLAATAPLYFFSGTYTWCVEAKLVSGSGATLTMSGDRTSGTTGTFSAVASPALSSTAQKVCATFTLSESTSNAPPAGNQEQLFITLSGTGAAVVLIDNSNLTSNSDTELTLWQNQVKTNLVTTEDVGSLRQWIGQNGSSFANETAPPQEREINFSASGQGYPGSGDGPYPVGQGLGEFLTQAFQLGIPRVSYVVPITTTPAEMVEYTDFISAPCSASTTGSIARCTNWQTAPFSSQFTEIDFSIGNEEWNDSAQGQAWPGFGTFPNWSYLGFTNSMCQAMKQDANYSSVLKCSATIQVGQASSGGFQSELNPSFVDFQDMNEYGTVGNGNAPITDTATPDLWESTWADYYIAGLNCAVTGTAFCGSYHQYPTIVYEYNNNTTDNDGITQSNLNGFANGMGYGLTDTLGPALLNLGKQAGNFSGMDQYNFFTLYQTSFGIGGGLTNFIWGAFTGAGGTMDRPRPSAQAMGAFNRAVGALDTGIIVPTSGIPTFNYSGNNGVEAQTDIPDVIVTEYEPSSTTRSLVFWNIDPAGASHTISISGTNAPSGTCSTTTFTSAHLSDNNETSLVVSPTTASAACTSSMTIPEFAMVTVEWSISSPLPTPPSNAFEFTNLQNSGNGFGTWTQCNTPACSGSDTGVGTSAVAFGVTSPVLESGSAMKITSTSTSGEFFNTLTFLHLGCTTLPGGCIQSVPINFLVDLFFEIPSSNVGLQALEFDPDLFDGVNQYLASQQCDSASGDWRLWDEADNMWFTTNFPCTLLSETNTTHHYQLYGFFNQADHSYTYETFVLDGTPIYTNLGMTFEPAMLITSQPTFNVQNQIDGNTAVGANVELLDNYNMWVWPASSISVVPNSMSGNFTITGNVTVQ
jgi:hypothetical protein